MVEISIQDQARDEETSANAGILRIGRVSAALPNKFATTAEVNATRVVGAKDTLPWDVVVSAKLMHPDSLNKLLKEMILCGTSHAGCRVRQEDSRMSLDCYFSSSKGKHPILKQRI